MQIHTVYKLLKDNLRCTQLYSNENTNQIINPAIGEELVEMSQDVILATALKSSI